MEYDCFLVQIAAITKHVYNIRMKTYESFIASKNGDSETCEDGLFISPEYIAVVDGATSKSKTLWENGATSGKHAKNVIIRTLSSLPYNLTAVEAIALLNDALREEYTKYANMHSDSCSLYLEASIVIFSAHRQEIWRYGDCQIRINNKNHIRNKRIDIVTKNARSAFLLAEIESGKATYDQLLVHDSGRDFIMPLLKMQSAFANRIGMYGYPVLNGQYEIINEYVEIFKVNKGDVIILASDGYPKLHSTLAQSEKHLSKILLKDPLLINEYLSTKGLLKGNQSFDDRAFIRFVI